MLDIAAPKHMEIEIRDDGKVVWIHLDDGTTAFRACRIENLVVTDHRTEIGQ